MTRVATVRLSVSAKRTATIEIPDDITPDKVADWLAAWADAAGMVGRSNWDDIDIAHAVTKIVGDWEPDPDDPAQVAWAEAQRLTPTAGQVDIFGGEVL